MKVLDKLKQALESVEPGQCSSSITQKWLKLIQGYEKGEKSAEVRARFDRHDSSSG